MPRKERTETKASTTPPLDYDKVAAAIAAVSDAARSMRASGLSREAIIVLIQSRTGIAKNIIGNILDAAEDLRRWCLTK